MNAIRKLLFWLLLLAFVFAKGFGFAIGVFAALLLLGAVALLLIKAETRDQAIA